MDKAFLQGEHDHHTLILGIDRKAGEKDGRWMVEIVLEEAFRSDPLTLSCCRFTILLLYTQWLMGKVWFWVAIPFPVSDPYKDNPFPDIPTWPKRPSNTSTDPIEKHRGNNGTVGDDGPDLPLDVNFYFFLFW